MTFKVNNNLVERKCTFSMIVMIDVVAPFQANVVQRIPEIALAKITKGVVVPVRVDPDDHRKVFIDFKFEVPTVTMPRSTGENSAAYILEHGKPIKVVFVGSQPMKLKNADGIEMFLLTLTVYEGVDTPYQVQVGNPVHASALPLLFPCSKLHARLGNGPNNIVVDWAAGPAT